MSGGGFTKAQRCEYMDLCRQMTSRDPAQMTRANRDRLLAFLKDYVVEHSAEYPEKREFIMETVSRLFENPAMLEDPNYLGSYNLVAFQCSILFTIVSMDMSPDDLEVCILYSELNKYDIYFYKIKNISKDIKNKRPISRSVLLTGLNPDILDKLESIIKKYKVSSNEHKVPSNEHNSNSEYEVYDEDEYLKEAIRRDFDRYPEVRAVTNESLEFLRAKCKNYMTDLNNIITKKFASKYNILSLLLRSSTLYFTFLGTGVWNNYTTIRDIIMRHQIGLYTHINYDYTERDLRSTIDPESDMEEAFFLHRLYSTDIDISQPLYLITIISYIYVQEFVDAIVHNVYYCGLAYKLQKADGVNRYPYHFLMHDYFHSRDSRLVFLTTPRIYFERLYTLIMRTTFKKDIRYSILLVLFYLLHEDESLIEYMASLKTGLDHFYYDSSGRFHDVEDLGLSIPKADRGSEASIDAYVTHSFKLFYEYFQAVKAMEDPLPKRSELSRSAKKLLNLYLDKEVSVSRSPNVNKMKRLLQTRKVAKQAAQKARKSKSRSHS
jgi:hypothetical protein